MKPISSILLAGFIIAGCTQNPSIVSNNKNNSSVQTHSQDSVSEKEKVEIIGELIKIEKDWAAVLANHDWNLLERVLAPDFVSVGLDEGKVNSNNKEQLIAKYKFAPEANSSATLSEVIADVHTKNMAVVRGYVTETGKSKEGKNLTSVWYWVDSYVRREGSWQCVVSYTSRVK